MPEPAGPASPGRTAAGAAALARPAADMIMAVPASCICEWQRPRPGQDWQRTGPRDGCPWHHTDGER